MSHSSAKLKVISGLKYGIPCFLVRETPRDLGKPRNSYGLRSACVSWLSTLEVKHCHPAVLDGMRFQQVLLPRRNHMLVPLLGLAGLRCESHGKRWYMLLGRNIIRYQQAVSRVP